MQRHENLFSFYGNKTDVYRKLQDDYLRDKKQMSWLITAFIVLMTISGFVENNNWRIVLFFGAGASLLQYLILFIEQSNRNHLMHVIDWLEAKED